ncbi:Gp38 [Cupriavidus phytorum]|uniref:Gp38 n=1 Tax=Cupriavidus taiwanensis TaxID=164546 RepID=A0A375C951_9BURK|nr:hypothetical protein [Cupriavidus taiwanensis]SOY65632.1 Gp38 [Cupriavidus taiwanensis]
MSEIKNGGPAFPGEKDVLHIDSLGYERGTKRVAVSGMTLRDYFAAKAMQGLCANNGYNQHSPATLANEAYGMADAMLKAREA